jgi:hypothetical protein
MWIRRRKDVLRPSVTFRAALPAFCRDCRGECGCLRRGLKVTLQPVKIRDDKNKAEVIGWAERVNSRWIAHHGLSENAEAYLNHLRQHDPDRLSKSCRRAHRLVRECKPGEDPKPWFYAALFSLATEAEARQFLADHWFTRVAIPVSAEEAGSDPAHIGGETRVKLDRIRQALRRLEHGD